MFIFPYSSALRIARRPYVTYGVVVLCVLVFLLQLQFQITDSFVYRPETWNPLKMLSSSIAHGSFWHIIGNIIFFMAFAPAVEALVGNRLRFIWIMIFISFVVGISYSISTLLSSSPALPTLGLSGIVMGMVGLSAYLMPTARIKVFFWFFVFWKNFYVPVWALALVYLGWDTITMFTAENYYGINVVAHVFGGVAGFGYGFLWLKDRKEETREELEDEIETMKIRQQHGETREKAHRYKKATEKYQQDKQQTRDFDKYMGHVYQCVKTHRDGEAICDLLARYDLTTPTAELETVLKRINDWGHSRTLLCFIRLIIVQLDKDKRYGRVVYYIEQCQEINPLFVLPDLSKTLFYARLAIDSGKPKIAKNLVQDSEKRYGNLVNADQCREFELQIAKEQVDIIL